MTVCRGVRRASRFRYWLGVAIPLAIVAVEGMGCRPRTSPPIAPTISSEATRETAEPSSAAGICFENVAAAAGVEFAYRNDEEQERAAIIEALGGGVALFDYDQDGWLDLFFPAGGQYAEPRTLVGRPHGLFRREAPWHYAPVATLAGVDESPYYSHGAAAADFDNDGFPDLLVTGYGGVALYRNQGDGTFVEIAPAAGLAGITWGASAAWGDVNGDGALDLYVAQYVDWSFDNDPPCFSRSGRRDWCSPQAFQALPDRLFLSNGEGTFRDASQEFGLRTDGKGLGVILVDLDLDHDLDAYVANDTTPNFLYRNDGPNGWREIGVPSGAGLDKTGAADGSMGVDAGDFNGDGHIDLWVVNFEQELFALYQNLGENVFLHATEATGLAASGGLYVGWGTALCDLDGDGDLDIATANGHAFRFPAQTPRRQMPLAFENLTGRRFRNVTPAAGDYFAQPHDGRGLAVGDLDNDGRIDVAISHVNEPVAVLRNRASGPPFWLGLKLIGRTSPRDAIGATVRVPRPQGEAIAQIKGGSSYLSTGDARLLLGGVAAPVVATLTIEWPSGVRQTLHDVETNRYVTILEPD